MRQQLERRVPSEQKTVTKRRPDLRAQQQLDILFEPYGLTRPAPRAYPTLGRHHHRGRERRNHAADHQRDQQLGKHGPWSAVATSTTHGAQRAEAVITIG